MFSNPWEDREKEIADFQNALRQFRETCEKDRLLLSFRSDYFTLVRKILDDDNIPWGELELFPLDRPGILQAIRGVMEKTSLGEFYRLAFYPPVLPDTICDDVSKDKNSSHVTPLLQYQLDKLFHKAAPDWEMTHDPVTITAGHYSDEFRKESLDALLEDELGFLKNDWPRHTESGLALDVLTGYITDQMTAAERPDSDICAAYAHVADFASFFDYLKNRRSLLIGTASADGQQAARLAHDSLAPLLYARFKNSTAPGQRAWQVLEPKLNDLNKGIAPTLISPEDLQIVQDGSQGMRRLPQLDELIKASRKDAENRERERTENYLYIFNSFADVGIELIYTLEHEKALEKFKTAVAMEFDPTVKQQKLTARSKRCSFSSQKPAEDRTWPAKPLRFCGNCHPPQPSGRRLKNACPKIGKTAANLLPSWKPCPPAPC
ncbi:MAG: hypothetical protein IPM81_14650 [Saprospirales bacterium]|nr:hypothetical protein [Saprospirales bacterium]